MDERRWKGGRDGGSGWVGGVIGAVRKWREGWRKWMGWRDDLGGEGVCMRCLVIFGYVCMSESK